MSDIKMKPGDILCLKVTRVEENKKSFIRNGSTVYKHNIYLDDGKGNASRKEYITSAPTIPLTEFIPGVFQHVKCITANDLGDEIQPYDPETQQAQMIPTRNGTALPHAAPADILTYQPQSAANCNDKNIGGKSITFCMAYAKDLKVAEISKQKAGYKVTEEDIQEVAAWAIKLNNEICDFLNL